MTRRPPPRTPRRRSPIPGPRAALTALGLLAALAPARAAEPIAEPPPVLDPARLGAPSFQEDFASFDHGVDQERPAKPHRWRTVFGYGGPNSPDNRMLTSNKEDDVFVDPGFGGLTGCPPQRIDPFRWRRGSLTIHAQRLSDPQKKCLGAGWSSGMISSPFSFSQKWGYFEGEIAIPLDRGFWPTFWLMPTVGKWPENGEIDILESVGPATPGGLPRQSTNVIWKAPNGGRADAQAYGDVITPGFHTYGVLWTPKTVSFYFDRRLRRTIETPPGLNAPMFFIADLVVGGPGSWPGPPDAATRQGDMTLRRISAWPLPAGSGQ